MKNSTNDSRWRGIERTYSQLDVERLRGSVIIEHTLARRGAEKLWNLLQTEDYVAALGALTGNQAVQQVKAGLKAIYVSGWQVAADANLAGQMYPDQSLYPANSVPAVVKRINQALQRADQIAHADESHHFPARVDEVVVRIERDGFELHGVAVGVAAQQLVDGVPTAHVVPAEIRGRDAAHLGASAGSRLLEHGVVDRDVLAEREDVLETISEAARPECRQ